ncbi:hypothetical protein ANCCAN_16979 [Ancylostoma caninum]|uniref:Uncharacterized protein n=1 Tax=Ancylostoma caninum TaxID=29170 RepID=A0A368G3F4_ANCCA|nr:hypothetical protein ANCCAN_16979 [Ancylostoma caninum]
MTTNIIHGNPQFQKLPYLRWTWESHGGETITKLTTSSSIESSVLYRSFTPDQIIASTILLTQRRKKIWKIQEAGLWVDAVVDNIDEEYDLLVQQILDRGYSAEG